jgi:regulator of sigma E protease
MLSQPPLWLVLVAFVCALGPLVFFHEMGHYLVARWFGVGAETFSIGFGREILGWTDKRGTRWKIGWVPLGGYVKFVGDMNPASAQSASDVPKELRATSFQMKPVWQRFLIVLAGPMANFLLAILILASIFTFVGTPLSNVIGKVGKGTAAEQAGLQPGDRILSIAGRSTPAYGDIYANVSMRPGETVSLVFRRDAVLREIQVKLGVEVVEDGSNRFNRGKLGVGAAIDRQNRLGVGKSLVTATETTGRMIRATVDGIVQLVTGRISPKVLGGPMKIAKVAGEGASEGAVSFVWLLAFLSINLGFINLLPVPMLDGGHLFFYGIEAVRRRPVSEATLEWAFRGGLAAILTLLLFTTVNDLGSFGLWEKLERLIG